jgi:ketosteroid isomerase-like protein
MDRTKIEAIIQQTYAARKAGDLDALANMFTPDGEYRLAGAAEVFPRAMTARGGAEIRRAIGSLVKEFQWMDVAPLDLIIDGDKAARRWQANVRHIPSGQVFRTEGSDIWTFREGKVASLIQFVDTAAVAEIVNAAEGRAPVRGQASRTAPQAGPPH